MKKRFKELIIYGLIPSSIIFIFYYGYFFARDIAEYTVKLTTFLAFPAILFILYFMIVLLIRFTFNIKVLLHYTGLKFIAFHQRVLYFVFTYLSLLAITTFFLKEEIYPYINKPVLISLPIILIVLLFISEKFLIFKVKFARVSPRLYIDFINIDLHKDEDLDNYTIIPVFDSRLHFYSLKTSHEYVKLLEEIEDEEQHNFFEKKIDYIDYEIKDEYIVMTAFDENEKEVWSEIVYYTENDYVTPELVEEVIQSVMYLENL